MNILVIGNGFDIAHELPTTYKLFLEFANQFVEYKDAKEKGEELSWNDGEATTFIEYINAISYSRKELFVELSELLEDNCWIEHFNQVKLEEGWIDFEREISEVIQVFDKLRLNIEKSKMTDSPMDDIPLYEQQKLCAFGFNVGKIFFEGIVKEKRRLLKDLNRLTRCLEIYLKNYAEDLTSVVKLPDIEGLDIHCVLSFNYTHTYEKIYHTDKSKKVKYDYLHGEVKEDSTLETCNLILGIDEYLKGKAKDKDNEFIQFKKFYQRIYKKTGCKYVDWINNVVNYAQKTAKVNTPPNNVYILGHSLDITDGDVLSSLINMPNTKTTIFYHNQKALGNQINNFVKILREDELISMVHGANARIIFKEQQEAVPRDI